jgi:hypothetical protein
VGAPWDKHTGEERRRKEGRQNGGRAARSKGERLRGSQGLEYLPSQWKDEFKPTMRET